MKLLKKNNNVLGELLGKLLSTFQLIKETPIDKMVKVHLKEVLNFNQLFVKVSLN